MSELLARLRERGWRMTPQRRVVVEVLEGEEQVHLTAEQVLTEARNRLPDISLATVYNTLNDLVASGELLEVSPDGGPRRYDPNVTTPHQHLTCIQCGAVLDVNPAPVPTLDEGDRHGYRLLGVDIVFRGRCPACAGQATPG